MGKIYWNIILSINKSFKPEVIMEILVKVSLKCLKMHKGLFTVISGIQEELQVRPFINTDFFVKQITAIIKMYYVLCFMYIWLVKLCCWLEQIFWLVCLILQCTCEAFLQILLVELLRLHDYSVMLAHTILTQKKLEGGQFFPQPPSLWFFRKYILQREGESLFFVSFHIIISHIFLENFIAVPKIFQKI